MSLAFVAATPNRTEAELRVQILSVQSRETKTGKPFCELTISDGASTEKLRIWDNHPSFPCATAMQAGQVYALTGTFWGGDFGLESDKWSARLLEGEERAAVFAGTPELRAKQQRDWDELIKLVVVLEEGSLKTLCTMLLTEHEEPFRRAAAARGNHHARRGGLVEHVSLMAQTALGVARVYPELRWDLLLAGVIFHDSGKMVENQYQLEGFEMPFSFRAECYGHIAIGVQLAHRLWQRLPAEAQEKDRPLLDALCHLILSHHGCAEWGSPVDPKLPEALVLHQVDMIDAKLEMMRAHKLSAQQVGPGVYEKHWALKVGVLELKSES